MLKITAGRFRSRVIECPKGKEVRPTTSYARESIFNIIGTRIIEARFLDVFAGCGVMGFEALSRGANFVVAVEKARLHANCIQNNAQKLQLKPSEHSICCMDYLAWLSQWQANSSDGGFDVVFLDPPFAMEDMNPWIELAIAKGVLRHPNSLLMWEHRDREVPITDKVTVVDRRRYGGSSVTWMHPVVS